MNDDFDPIEDFDEEDQMPDFDQSNYNSPSIKERYNNLQENKEKWQGRYDKAKEYKDKLTSNTGKNVAQNTGKGTAKSAGNKAAKSAGNKAKNEVASSMANKASKEAIRNTGKTVAKEGAKTAAKAGAKTAAAAGTAGASVAVDAVVEAAKVAGKAQKKVLKGFDKVTGLNTAEHQKKINVITTLLMPIACCICICFICFLSGSTQTTNQSIIEGLKKAIDMTLEEINKDAGNFKVTLATMNGSDVDKLEDNIYKVFRDKDAGLHYAVEGLILNPKTAEENEQEQQEQPMSPDIFQQEDKSNLKGSADYIAKKFAKFITPYLLVEKENFNKIFWQGIDCSTGEEFAIDLDKDRDTDLKIPDERTILGEGNENNDPFKLAEELHPYLEQWIIPVSNYITTSDPKFLETFREEMLHKVLVKRFYIYKYETKVTKVYKVATKEVEEVDENGKKIKKTVPDLDANGNYKKTLISEQKSGEEKSLKEVKNVIDTARTFWGVIMNNPTFKSRDESTKTENTETGELSGDFTVTEVTTITYSDSVKTEKKTEEYKIWVDGKEEELKKEEEESEEDDKKIKDTYPRTFRSAYISNSPIFYEKYKFKYSAQNLESANDYIKKYHEDAYIKEVNGSFGNSIAEKDGMSFIWPVKDDKATIISSWYKEHMFSEDNGLTIVTDIKKDEKYEVVATASGKVNYIRNIFGKDSYTIEILHDKGYKTIYTNVTNLPDDLKPNSEVNVGDVIGEMAKLPLKDELTLKYSIYKVNEIVDPFEFYLYSEENSEKYKKLIRKYTGLKSSSISGGGSAGVMVMSEDWNKRIAAMIDEALKMAEEKPLIYSMALRENPYKDTRQHYSDCSSFVANLYYRFFDKAQIGTWTGPQYNLEAQGINAIAIENHLDSEDKLNHSVLMPGDLIFQNGGAAGGAGHVMMYIGGYKDYPPGTVVHENGPRWSSGPNIMNFNEAYGPSMRAKHRGHAVRFYRDGDIISTGGSAGGGLGLDGIEKGSKADSPLVNKVVNEFGPSIKKWSAKFGIDPGVVVGMICQESGGNPRAYNGYAMGLMQIEHVHWGKTINMEFADGTSEKHVINSNRLYDPDYNIMIGCWEFSTQIKGTYGNVAVAIQGYNYGYGGIRRCIGYHLSGGANTGSQFCGMSEAQFKQYCESGDTGWLAARSWYTSTGWRIFGGGGGTKDHLERVLQYYKPI